MQIKDPPPFFFFFTKRLNGAQNAELSTWCPTVSHVRRRQREETQLFPPLQSPSLVGKTAHVSELPELDHVFPGLTGTGQGGPMRHQGAKQEEQLCQLHTHCRTVTAWRMDDRLTFGIG